MSFITVRPHDAPLVAPEPADGVALPLIASYPSAETDPSFADDRPVETEWPIEVDRSRDPLSPGVTALIGIAALALSAVCTTLLLTFASTNIGVPLLGDDFEGSSVVQTIDD